MKALGAEIPLSQGKKAIVDAEDAPRLLARPWFAKKDQADNFYALTNIKAPSGRWETRSMHREVIGARAGEIVDHINRNTLDNRKSNLRIASASQSNFNRRTPKNNKSGHRGVRALRGKWAAFIGVNRKRIYLGLFSKKSDAARAYANAATKYFGASV